MHISCMKMFLLLFPPLRSSLVNDTWLFAQAPYSNVKLKMSITPTRMITVVVLDGSPQQSPPFHSGHQRSSIALHTSVFPNHTQSNSSMHASSGLAMPAATPSRALNAPDNNEEGIT